MIHAFHIADGRVAYRNRWVRTRQWTLERGAGRALFGTSGDPRDVDPEVAGVRTDGVANTHIVWHAGKLLALEEGHGPIEIDPVSLDTIGPWNFDQQLPGNMTAHPKIDPVTGEMLFFANFPSRAFTGEIAFYVADAHGRIVRHQSVQGPFPALVHDFAITRDFVIFVVCPVTLSIERARAGGAADRVGAVPRHARRRAGARRSRRRHALVYRRRVHGVAFDERVQQRRAHLHRRLPAGGARVSRRRTARCPTKRAASVSDALDDRPVRKRGVRRAAPQRGRLRVSAHRRTPHRAGVSIRIRRVRRRTRHRRHVSARDRSVRPRHPGDADVPCR